MCKKGCSFGVYGENCEKPCPDNCQGSRCDIINGTCSGCTPGWLGARCDKSNLIKKILKILVKKHCMICYKWGFFYLFTKHALSDIMVYSVNQAVLEIVKTARRVITSVVCVTTDVIMVGQGQTVTKV